MVYLFCELMSIVGSNSLFQLATKVKIACVARAGFIIGIAMVLNVRSSLQPSMRAASRISSGRPAIMYWRMKNTSDGEAMAGTISGT